MGKPYMIGTTMLGQLPPAAAPYVNRLDSWLGRFLALVVRHSDKLFFRADQSLKTFGEQSCVKRLLERFIDR